ncbi:MAG: HAMP domain-containing sensor histidine kinase [Candidatus Saccharimonadales bacterium]
MPRKTNSSVWRHIAPHTTRSMKGYVSMVLDGDMGDLNDSQKSMLQQAYDSSQRMVYLISDLLNVSRLRTGKFIIQNKVTDLVQVVNDELRQLSTAATARKVHFTFNKPDNFPKVVLDEMKVRQVIMNFLDNALYYSPDGGEVIVELAADDKTIRYMVTDHGLGVPKEEQKYLFTKFYRAQNARKIRPDGTGLGLYMARKVIAAQGGAIIFKSTEGEGSTFGFSFPLENISTDKNAPQPKPKETTDDSQQLKVDHSH